MSDMSIRDTFKSVFDNDYCGAKEFIAAVLVPVFGERDVHELPFAEENPTGADDETLRKANIQEIYRVATIERVGTDPIEVFDVTLGDSTDLSRARVGIQRIIRSSLFPYSHAFILFHHKVLSCSEWRFSYVYKQDKIRNTTDAKRFTYLFSRDLHARTAIDRFCVLAESDKSNEALLEAFNVEALSDDFFEEYRAQYAKFVKYITGKEYVKDGNKYVEKCTAKPNAKLYASFGRDDKAVRDYVKKMMGRITFLHFLQRKGWMKHDMNYMLHLFERSNHKDNYLDMVLEPLFFGIMNTKKENRLSLFKKEGWDLALLDEWIDIPYLNGGLFEQEEVDKYDSVFPAEFFASLFKFFSEYNFTVDENDPDDAEVGVDPEMLGKIFENLLEDNKDKGAFYTPKEIVRYMCQESLIEYLSWKSGIAEERVRNFVIQPYDYVDGFSDAEKNRIYDYLDKVRICDPAIGSGAFPMGLLNQLVRCEEALLGEKEDGHEGRAGLKKSIIKNNIYGVDIEKGAIDIARLRFWLSIVVDEEDAEPLPNLDYKIMQGNSLIESYKSVNLSHLTELGEDVGSIFGAQIANTQVRLKEKLDEYYGSTDHSQKKSIQQEISDLIQEQIDAKGIDLDLSEIDVSGNTEFFLWHTWFADVFSTDGAEGGFDIVIGNPPYLSSKAIREDEKRLYRSAFETTSKQFDLFSLFIELSFSLAKKKGVLSFIVPDSLIGRSNFEDTRRMLIGDGQIIKWLHLNNVFESANVASLIYVCRVDSVKSYTFDYQKAETVTDWQKGDVESIKISSEYVLKDEAAKVIFADSTKLNVLSYLKDYPTFDSAFHLWRGEEIGKKSDVIQLEKTKTSLPLQTGEDVHRYEQPSNTRWILPSNVQKDAPYNKPKLIIRQLGDCINATIDLNGAINTQSVYSIIPLASKYKIDDLWFYLALLNSSLFNFIYELLSGDKQTFKRIILENIKALPLPKKIELKAKEQIVSLAKERFEETRSERQLQLEREIDKLVLGIYELPADIVNTIIRNVKA